MRADLSPEVGPQVPGQVPLLRRRPVPNGARAVGRRAQPAGDGEDHAVPAQRAGARRADQPPRHPGARDAGGGARRLRGHAASSSATTATSSTASARACWSSRGPRRGAHRQLQRLAAARATKRRPLPRRSRAAAPTPTPQAGAQAAAGRRRRGARRRQGAGARAAPAGAARGDAGGGCGQAGERSWRRCARSWPAITRGDWQKLHTLADRERELDALLARRMAEWEAASAAALNQAPEHPPIDSWKPTRSQAGRRVFGAFAAVAASGSYFDRVNSSVSAPGGYPDAVRWFVGFSGSRSRWRRSAWRAAAPPAARRRPRRLAAAPARRSPASGTASAARRSRGHGRRRHAHREAGVAPHAGGRRHQRLLHRGADLSSRATAAPTSAAASRSSRRCSASTSRAGSGRARSRIEEMGQRAADRRPLRSRARAGWRATAAASRATC